MVLCKVKASGRIQDRIVRNLACACCIIKTAQWLEIAFRKCDYETVSVGGNGIGRIRSSDSLAANLYNEIRILVKCSVNSIGYDIFWIRVIGGERRDSHTIKLKVLSITYRNSVAIIPNRSLFSCCISLGFYSCLCRTCNLLVEARIWGFQIHIGICSAICGGKESGHINRTACCRVFVNIRDVDRNNSRVVDGNAGRVCCQYHVQPGFYRSFQCAIRVCCCYRSISCRVNTHVNASICRKCAALNIVCNSCNFSLCNDVVVPGVLTGCIISNSRYRTVFRVYQDILDKLPILVIAIDDLIQFDRWPRPQAGYSDGLCRCNIRLFPRNTGNRSCACRCYRSDHHTECHADRSGIGKKLCYCLLLHNLYLMHLIYRIIFCVFP